MINIKPIQCPKCGEILDINNYVNQQVDILYNEDVLRDIIFSELKKENKILRPEDYYSENNRRQLILE